MEGRGVIVDCSMTNEGRENSKLNGESEGKNGGAEGMENLSCSGIYLGNGLILTHGTIITDMLRHPASHTLLQTLQTEGCVKAMSCRGGLEGGGYMKGKNTEMGVTGDDGFTIRMKDEGCEKRLKGDGNEVEVKGESFSKSWLRTGNYQKEDVLSAAISVTQAKFRAIIPVLDVDQSSRELTDLCISAGLLHRQLSSEGWEVLHNRGDSKSSCINGTQENIQMNGGKGIMASQSPRKSTNMTVTSNPRTRVYNKQDGTILNTTYLTSFQASRPLSSQESIQSPPKQPSLSPSFQIIPARVERLFVLPSLRERIEGLMPASEGWRFTDDEQEKETKSNTHFQNIIMSTFVLLKMVPLGTGSGNMHMKVMDDTPVAKTVTKMITHACSVHKGMTLLIESSPFGSLSPSVFLNSLSRGIVSNTAQPLLLTDARCILGSEGAPVFTYLEGRQQLCGMVVSPFCWRGGEWLGLTLLAAIRSILIALLQSCSQSGELPNLRDWPIRTEISRREAILARGVGWPEEFQSSEEHWVKDVMGGVVGDLAGEGWGSGMVVSARPPLVLTCAHVTRPAQNGRVTLVLSDRRTLVGQVLHQTQPTSPVIEGERKVEGSSLWDLALISSTELLPDPITLALDLPHAGTEVMVAGYGVFNPTCLLSPSISRGVLSRVITAPSSALIWPSSFVCPQLAPGHVHSDTCSCSPKESDPCSRSQKQSQAYQSAALPSIQPPTYNETRHGIKCLTQDNGHTQNQIFRNPQDTEVNYNQIWIHGGRRDKYIGTKSERRHKGGARRGGSVAVVMQTTCSVYAGISGGPVVALHPTRGPEVVGIVACNTKDAANNATFPHINLAIPTPLIGRVVAAYTQMQDPRILRLLDVECPAASCLWALRHLPRSSL